MSDKDSYTINKNLKRPLDKNHMYKQEIKKPKEENPEIWGKITIVDEEETNNQNIVKEKANFGLTGALAKDTNTGNTIQGVVLKWTEPLDAEKPTLLWRFYVFKDDKLAETLHLHRKSSYLIGRDHRVADVVLAHPSCSSQHAVLQFRKIKKRDKESGELIEKVIPYLMDLQSVNKTFVNGEVIDESRYYELREKDIIKFAFSTREYVLLHEKSES